MNMKKSIEVNLNISRITGVLYTVYVYCMLYTVYCMKTNYIYVNWVKKFIFINIVG